MTLREKKRAALVRTDRRAREPVVGTRAVFAAGAVMVVLVILMATGLFVAQHQVRAHVLGNFYLRSEDSASVVAQYVGDLGSSETRVGATYLGSQTVDATSFEVARAAFGFDAATLLDANGRPIVSSPARGSALTRELVTLFAAEDGRDTAKATTTVSNAIASPRGGDPEIAVAIRFETSTGERILVGAVTPDRTSLVSYLDHAVLQADHQVYVIGRAGRIIASSSPSGGRFLGAVDPQLASSLAASRSSSGAAPAAVGGTFTGPLGASSFAVSPVLGTPWRLVTVLPTFELYASAGGWSSVVPWMILGVVMLLALALGLLLVRIARDRKALSDFSTRMEQAARTDLLTGLPNRRRLTAAIGELTAAAALEARSFSVLMMDLDKFKPINDTYGHDVGDDVLRLVSRCMHEVFRHTDVWGRWGGDEFLALLPDASGPEAESAAARLMEALRNARFEVDGDPVPLDLSVGCATGAGDAAELVSRADEALYLAKRAGGGRVVRVEDELSVIRQV